MSEPDETVLLKVLGQSPELRVLDAFIDNPIFSLTVDDVSRISGLEQGEAEKVLETLQSWDILLDECKSAEEPCYALNHSNDAVRHLVKFDLCLAEQERDEGLFAPSSGESEGSEDGDHSA